MNDSLDTSRGDLNTFYHAQRTMMTKGTPYNTVETAQLAKKLGMDIEDAFMLRGHLIKTLQKTFQRRLLTAYAK